MRNTKLRYLSSLQRYTIPLTIAALIGLSASTALSAQTISAIQGLPALQDIQGQMHQPIQVTLSAGSGTVSIQADGAQPKEVQLAEKPTHAHLLVPAVEQETTLNIAVQKDGKTIAQQSYTLQPVRKWHVDFVQHTHTDIGYTHPQSEILPKHLSHIDDALDYCKLTDEWNDDDKFRWSCELTWAVREYLKRRPTEQIERLKKWVQKGRIEIAGMFLNMAEIADETSLAASMQSIRTIRDKLGANIRTAMQNDVNGIAWCMPDYFNQVGIKYLNMGINNTRSLLPYPDHPTPFWWASPSGNKVLAFRADHYMRGNKLMIHRGDPEDFADRLLVYLQQMNQKGYPYDHIAIQYSGYRTDNSSPSIIPCQMIKAFNAKYTWPKLRSSTVSNFLSHVEEHYGDDLPVQRQAWSDWWTDGFASAALTTAASRNTHSAMQQIDALLAMASYQGTWLANEVSQRIMDIQEGLLFYDEHTFGSYKSIRDPFSAHAGIQWGQKSSFAWSSMIDAGMLRQEALGHLQRYVPRTDGYTVTVFNTLNWKRSGPVHVKIEHNWMPPDRRNKIVDLTTGEEIPTQYVEREGNYYKWIIWAKDVPPLGYKVFEVQTRPEFKPKLEPVFHQAGFQLLGYAESGGELVSFVKEAEPTSVLENEYYKIQADPQTGAVTSMVDKETGRELVDQSSQWKLGQMIHEVMANKNRRDNRPENFERSTVTNVQPQPGIDDEVFKTMVFTADMDGAKDKGIRCEIRLYKHAKLVEFVFSIRKTKNTDPEAVYVAFPFNMPDGQMAYEAQGGTVHLPEDLLPGSSSDWNTVQHYLSVRDDDGQIVWSSHEVPLVHLGGLNMGKWMKQITIEQPHVYSWVMNNYWFTNFRATQEGEFNWHYALTSTTDRSETKAAQFGRASRIPLVTTQRYPGENEEGPMSGSLLKLDTPNVLMAQIRPSYYSKDSMILHLREIEGKKATVHLGNADLLKKLKTVYEVDVLERTIKVDVNKVHFEPYESRFFRLRR